MGIIRSTFRKIENRYYRLKWKLIDTSARDAFDDACAQSMALMARLQHTNPALAEQFAQEIEAKMLKIIEEVEAEEGLE